MGTKWGPGWDQVRIDRILVVQMTSEHVYFHFNDVGWTQQP